MGIFDKIKNAIPQAKQIIGGFNPNSTDDVQKFLKSKGMDGGWAEDALKWAVPIAKGAKMFGPKSVKDALKDINIDDTAAKVRDLTKSKNSNYSQPQYPSYDRRNTQYYQNQNRSSNLPD